MIIYLGVVGVLLAAGLASIIYTLPFVTPMWRPLYFLALPLTSGALFLFIRVFAHELVGWPPPHPQTLRLVLGMVFALLAFETILVPKAHRLERRNRGTE